MIELVLIRHAKSSWSDPNLADHDRPLNKRGRRNAPMMAQRFAERSSVRARENGNESGANPPRILSSTAVRARTTAEVFGEELGVDPELDEDLYLASASTLLATAADSGAPSVMVVAHNPGISDLASYLSGGGIDHMPTCAVARFVWEVDSWSEATARPVDSWSLDTPR